VFPAVSESGLGLNMTADQIPALREVQNAALPTDEFLR
jgi:hypothetical protein